MRRLLGLAAASLVLLGGGASASGSPTPSGFLFIVNDSPAALSYVVNGGPERTIKAGGRFGEPVSAGQNRVKVTGRGFAWTKTLTLSTSDAHDNGQGPGSLRWCLSVTAKGQKLMLPQACFKLIMSK